MPPSRAKAYIMRLFDSIEKMPQRNIAPMTITCPRRAFALALGPPETCSALHRNENARAHHEDDGSLLADGVQEYLGDGLAGGRVDRAVEVLDREEEPQEKQPAEHGRDPDGHDDAHRAGDGCVVRLLRHLVVPPPVRSLSLPHARQTHVCASVEPYVYVRRASVPMFLEILNELRL